MSFISGSAVMDERVSVVSCESHMKNDRFASLTEGDTSRAMAATIKMAMDF